MIKRIEYIIKHNRAMQFIFRISMSLFFRLIGLFIRTKEKTVLFSSFSGKSFNDSPRVVYDELIKREDFKEWDFVWAFEKPELFVLPKGRKVQINSFKYFIIAISSSYWVANVNIERGLMFKKRKTRFLHTGHGTGPQLSGNAVKGKKYYNYSNVDVMCADGPFIRDIYINDFKAKAENFVMCGRPREDELFNITRNDVQNYRKLFGIPNNKKVILYAPTWRDDAYNPKGIDFNVIPIQIERWKKSLSHDYVVIFRAHSQAAVKNNFIFDEFFINGSDYPFINHQIAIADIVISDYSSLMWDAALISKPIISFAYDYENYKKTRGLYFDMKSVFPGGIIDNEEDLLKRILNFSYDEERKLSIMLKNKFITRDSKSATKICIEALFYRKKVAKI